jgi:hypothetical protein
VSEAVVYAFLLAIFIALTMPLNAGESDSPPPTPPYYSYTDALHHDCNVWGIKEGGQLGLCEVVSVESLTKKEARKRGLWYRAISWGKHFPADEDGYYIAASGEFIPQSWAVASPDNKFHRCTYPVNKYWAGPPESKWKVRTHPETTDGKPPTRCFWKP